MHTLAVPLFPSWSQLLWLFISRHKHRQHDTRDRQPGWYWRTEEGQAFLRSVAGSSRLEEDFGDQREED